MTDNFVRIARMRLPSMHKIRKGKKCKDTIFLTFNVSQLFFKCCNSELHVHSSSSQCLKHFGRK